MFTGDNCGKAREAAQFYTSVVPDARIIHIKEFEPGEPGAGKGWVKHVQFSLGGMEYMAADDPNGDYSFNPSISIAINCETEQEIQTLYQALSKDGKVMMPMDSYGFSRKFAFLSDKYHLCWQLILF
jgi:predicted 3-demethylubiquinone-9 3-methyltransferase (glyoxalase superfamily)